MEELREAAQFYYDRNRANIALDNGETLEEFYVRETKRSIRKCDVCDRLLLGYYYCCTSCELYKNYNYNLCNKCFHGGTFEHEHDEFADCYSVLAMHNQGRSAPSCVIEKKPNGKQIQLPPSPVVHEDEAKGEKGHLQPVTRQLSYKRPRPQTVKELVEQPVGIRSDDMEKLSRVAEAHYNGATQTIRDVVDKFFRSMVKEGRLRVTLNDFMTSMIEGGYEKYAREDLFRLLLNDGNDEELSFSEVRTLYYIILCKKPFCSSCDHFIPDTFFCCSKCSATNYALCLDCYANKAHLNHHHFRDGDAFFLDYELLHSGISPNHESSVVIVEDVNQQGRSKSKAIVKPDKVAAGLNLFQALLGACTAALSFASVGCTIM